MSETVESETHTVETTVAMTTPTLEDDDFYATYLMVERIVSILEERMKELEGGKSHYVYEVTHADSADPNGSTPGSPMHPCSSRPTSSTHEDESVSSP